jgi:hypothetical protein
MKQNEYQAIRNTGSNMFTYDWLNYHLNLGKVTRGAGINLGILQGAQGAYCTKAGGGGHLGRVLSDQKVLEMIRRERLVHVIRGQESQN